MKHTWILIAGLGCTLTACELPQDNVIFATNASFGVDVDSAPPTFSVGYSRDELSMGPITNEGEIIPVMSSFSAGANIFDSVFAAGISQSFAVGNAAYILSKYFTSTANPAFPDGDPIPKLVLTADACYFAKSCASGANGCKQDEICYIFGTTTNLGFKTAANTATGTIDSVSLGYKRKEAAFAPVTQIPACTDDDGNPIADAKSKMVAPPLFATVTGGATANGKGGGASGAQLYATGHAATYLTAAPGLRSTLAKPFARESITQDILTAISQQALAKVQGATQKTIERNEAAGKAWEAIDAAAAAGKLNEARTELTKTDLASASDKNLKPKVAGKTAPEGETWWEDQSDEDKVKSLKRYTVPGSGPGRAKQLQEFTDAVNAILGN